MKHFFHTFKGDDESNLGVRVLAELETITKQFNVQCAEIEYILNELSPEWQGTMGEWTFPNELVFYISKIVTLPRSYHHYVDIVEQIKDETFHLQA